jgi:gluconolactonase
MMRPRNLAVLCLLASAACADALPESESGPSEPGSAAPELGFERLDPRFDALVPGDAVIEVLGDGMRWSEGPVWNPADSSILVSDVIANVIYRWKEGEGLQPYIEPSGYTGTEPYRGLEPGSNGLILDSQGRLVLAQHGDRRVARREADGTFTTLADRYQGRRFNSPNDLVYGPNGDLYFTDPPYGLPDTFESSERELDFQGVYRLTPAGEVHLVTRDLNAPNGIGISPDGSTLYVSNTDDTFVGWMAYPLLADGSVGPGRVFAMAVFDGPGNQDGLDIDERGNVFATGTRGVHVFDPDGTLLGRILTNDRTGNVTWGDDGSVLYIAANHRLLRVRTNTRGMVHFQHR